MPQHWPKAAIFVAVGTVVTFFLLAAAQGIIGNRADAAFLWMYDQMIKSITASVVPWLVAIALLIVSSGSIVAWKRDRLDGMHKLNLRNSLIEVDDSLLRLLPYLVSTKNSEHVPNPKCLEDQTCARDRNCILDCEIHQLIKKFLRDATKIFPKDVHRALLFRPDTSTNNEYLTLWELYGGIDEDSRRRKRFYVGPPKADKKRGVAGEAFYTRKLIVTHILEVEDRWKSDNENIYISYEPFDAENAYSPYPSYCSFVCIPIIVGGGKEDCLGVLYFGSKSGAIFDPPEIKEVLLLLGRRLAGVLLTYQELQTIYPELHAHESSHISSPQ